MKVLTSYCVSGLETPQGRPTKASLITESTHR